jgi:hypothetical protein
MLSGRAETRRELAGLGCVMLYVGRTKDDVALFCNRLPQSSETLQTWAVCVPRHVRSMAKAR